MLLAPSLHDSIVVSIPACHAGDRGSIPRRGALFYFSYYLYLTENFKWNERKLFGINIQK